MPRFSNMFIWDVDNNRHLYTESLWISILQPIFPTSSFFPTGHGLTFRASKEHLVESDSAQNPPCTVRAPKEDPNLAAMAAMVVPQLNIAMV